jgi:heme o synthase
MMPNCADGDRRTRSQAVLFAAMLLPISLLPVSPAVSRAGWAYAIGATVLGILFLRAAIHCAKRQPNAEKKLFLTSIAYLPLLLAVLMADQ